MEDYTEDRILQNLLRTSEFESEFDYSIVVTTSLVTGFLALVWGLIYFSLDEHQASWIFLGYFIVSMFILMFYSNHKSRNNFLFTLQLLLLLLAPFLSGLILGGFIESSGVVIWCFVPAFLSMYLPNYSQSKYWFIASTLLVITNILLVSSNPSSTLNSNNSHQFLLIANLIGSSSCSFLILLHFNSRKKMLLDQIQIEKEKADNLISNVLPPEVIPYLRDGFFYVEKFEFVSILFADMVGFSNLTKSIEPVILLGMLNSIYSAFDKLIEKYGAEKIRTIGDSYMVCIGAPKPDSNHASKICELSLEMMEYMKDNYQDKGISFRVGINSGSAIGGVIGQNKFHFDIWSEDVNIASRMESHGISGRIQITEQTYKLVKDAFICENRGAIEIKGGGTVLTYFLNAKNGS